MPMTTVSPSRTGRLVIMPSKGRRSRFSAVRRRRESGSRRSARCGVRRIRSAPWPARSALGLSYAGFGGLPSCFSGVVFRFAISCSLVEALGTIPVEFGALGRPWRASRSAFAVLRSASAAMASVRAASSAARVAATSAAGLHVFELCQQLALLHPIAFLDIELVILPNALAPMLT